MTQAHHTASPQADTPSLAVLLLGFVGAQFVMWPVLGLLAAALGNALVFGKSAWITGLALAALALWLLRQSRVVFLEQLGLSLLLVAQVLWAVGWMAHSAPRSGWPVAGLLLFQLALAGWCRQAWIQRLLGLLASGSFLSLPALPWPQWLGGHPYATESWMQLLHQWPHHVGLLALLWALYMYAQGRFASRSPICAALPPVADGAVVGLLLALVVKSSLLWWLLGSSAAGSADVLNAGQAQLWTLSAASGMQAVVVLLCGGGLHQRWQPKGRAVGLLWLVVAAAAAACWVVPDMGAIAMVVSVAAAWGRWRTLWLALVVLLLALGNFYYALQWPLVDKAAALALLGVVIALALWSLRLPPHAQPAAPVAAPTPAHRWHRALAPGVMVLMLVVMLGLVQRDVQRKETVIAQGQKIFIPLQPRDPRSLMQGDYMALGFALPPHVRQDLQQVQHTQPWRSHLLALAEVDARGVAQVLRLALPQEHPRAPQMLLPLKRLKGDWVVVTDAFFFPEGQGRPLAAAKFGEFRVLPDGRALLVGLADAHLQPVLPGKLADKQTAP